MGLSGRHTAARMMPILKQRLSNTVARISYVMFENEWLAGAGRVGGLSKLCKSDPGAVVEALLEQSSTFHYLSSSSTDRCDVANFNQGTWPLSQ